MSLRRNSFLARVVLSLLLVGSAVPSLLAEPVTPPPLRDFALEHVTVLAMTPGGVPLPDTTVVVRNGRIARVAPSGKTSLPGDLARIDGRGKWLIPGLTDMHVHLGTVRLLRLMLKNPEIPQEAVAPEDTFAPYLAHGIVRVMDMQALAESIGYREEIAAGRMLGPTIHAAAMIDGETPIWPPGTTRVAASPEDGRQAVRDAKTEGYDLVKVYSRLTFETFSAIVDEGRRLGIPVVGHLPLRRSDRTAELFQPGFRLVAHAEEFALQTAEPAFEAIPKYVALMKANGTALTSTLTLNDRLLEQTETPATLLSRPEIRTLNPYWRDMVVHQNPYVAFTGPERIRSLRRTTEFNRALVLATVQAGVPVIAGTDSMVPGVVPGYALHDELVALTVAGLTPTQALEAATRLPAEWLNVAADAGTVEEGKRADLVLLDANPLEDIANTRRISGVILGGRYLPAPLLQQWMTRLAERQK